MTAFGNAESLARVARDMQGADRGDCRPESAYGALKRCAGRHRHRGRRRARPPSSEAAARPVDIVVAGIVGAAGLAPTLAAIRAGSRIALANKECLVCAGEIFMGEARRAGIKVLPVNSEHNAIFQALARARRSRTSTRSS